MIARNSGTKALGAIALAIALAGSAMAAPPSLSPPASFEVADRAAILVVHAEGAQIYECKADASGHIVWTFREPIAALISEGKTVGRHYAGPSWELDDGSAIKGKVLANAPGAGPQDIALLKLSVVEHRGTGALGDASLVLRLNTHGGGLKGDCASAGEFRAEAYSADYAFLR